MTARARFVLKLPSERTGTRAMVRDPREALEIRRRVAASRPTPAERELFLLLHRSDQRPFIVSDIMDRHGFRQENSLAMR